MARAVTQEQLGFDETPVTDSELESALEERLRRKVVLDEVRKTYDEAHAAAAVEIEKQELPDGKVIRVGRFRISRSAVSARSVSFEAKATSRIRITLLDADEAEGTYTNGVADDAPPARPPAKDDGNVVDLANAAARAREASDTPDSLRNRTITP